MTQKFLYVNTTTGDYMRSEAYELSEFKNTGGAGSENAPILGDGSGLLAASFLPSVTVKTDADSTLGSGITIAVNAATTFTDYDLVDKLYVDGIVTGLSIHQPVRVASTANVAGYVYNNGTAGVGAYLEAPTSASSYNTIDSVLLSVNDRVLVKDQTASEYEVSTTTMVATDPSNYANKYYWIFTQAKSYYVWCNYDSGGVDPDPSIPAGGPSTKQGVEIAVATSHDESDIAATMRSVIGALDDFNTSGASASVIITNTAAAEVKDMMDGNMPSGCTFTTDTEGKDAGYQNGIYYVSALGNDDAVKFKMIRATDYDNSPNGEITDGDFCFIQEGTSNAHRGFVQTYPGFDQTGSGKKFVVGETKIQFTQFSGAGEIAVTSPIKKTGDNLSLAATGANKILYSTDVDTWTEATATSFGRSLLDDANAAAGRSTLELGTISTQDADNVSISGGSISSITDLAVADGGTGASTLTDHGVLIGSGTAAITPASVGTDGQLLIGKDASDPAFATVTSSGSTLAFSAGANSLSIGVNFATASSDNKAVKASDLSSVANAKGASWVGIEDAGGYTDQTTVEAALQDIFSQITTAAGIDMTVGATGVTKGDLLYVSGNNTVLTYTDITTDENPIGLAKTTVAAAGTVEVIGIGHILTGVLSLATAGNQYYWTGSGWSTTIPSDAGKRIYEIGVAKNADDAIVKVNYVFTV